MIKQEARNILQSGYFHPVLRKWHTSSTSISADNLMYPIFITDAKDAVEPIKNMPGVYRYGVNQLKSILSPLVKQGLKSVLLFGVITDLEKDKTGSSADSTANPVVQAIPNLRKWFPDLVIACDVCLCAYTDHGHCGILYDDGSINNMDSIRRIGEIAYSYGTAGAHIVAPSCMMDGMIAAIKSSLGYLVHSVSVLSYSAKFFSSFYGPFREAAKSAPAFGDRKCYQLPGGSSGLAQRAAERDVREGADMLMVKPGLAYLDIVKQIKSSHPEYPMFIYQVSGEYSMLYLAAENGIMDLKAGVTEVLQSMRRAGADVIITYFTPKILEWLAEGDLS
ncbi:unnamed protein product [Bemisia tabaci]|uniref:Delta-aminolevulinic acid dehydratase n=1 Tax=Bemisia tabaci TaxID=7038 RepID=A0A9P0EYX3_BEMTA|nr:PREDICTED: delta-aminolevulinic acid dehydratase [Bemisia tabaci]CAH0384866.1 unnamed protein product [Bemisia tabaci]